jgi:DNA-binding transcriptional MerR regulator
LTTGELCKRWNITPDTLHNWEKQGKIAKMPLGGRKKMYSLKDVEEAEVSGIVIAKAS